MCGGFEQKEKLERLLERLVGEACWSDSLERDSLERLVEKLVRKKSRSNEHSRDCKSASDDCDDRRVPRMMSKESQGTRMQSE